MDVKSVDSGVLMTNLLIEAVSIALNTEFGSEYRVYADNVEQGLQEPCFFVSCVKNSNRLFFGKRYLSENLFCIKYFPADRSREKEECSQVAERLFLCLEWLTADGDLTMGTKMHSETVDGVLNFFVNYDMFVYLQSEKTPVMEELHADVSAKE